MLVHPETSLMPNFARRILLLLWCAEARRIRPTEGRLERMWQSQLPPETEWWVASPASEQRAKSSLLVCLDQAAMLPDQDALAERCRLVLRYGLSVHSIDPLVGKGRCCAAPTKPCPSL